MGKRLCVVPYCLRNFTSVLTLFICLSALANWLAVSDFGLQVMSKTHAHCETKSWVTLFLLYLETQEILAAFLWSARDSGDNVQACRTESSS